MRHADGVNDVTALEDLRQSDDLKASICTRTLDGVWIEVEAENVAV